MTASQETPVFVSAAYDEAMALLVQAKNYAMYVERKECLGLSPMERLVIHQESIALTSRLLRVLAWILWRKAAILEGAPDDPPFMFPDLELFSNIDDLKAKPIPKGLYELILRSNYLYIRMARLEAIRKEEKQNEIENAAEL